MRLRTRALILVAALALAAVGVYTLPVTETLGAVLRWIDANRATAWVVYIAGYAMATVLLVPGSIVTIAAGFIFGLTAGVAIVSAASVLGATAAFLLGRSLVRDWVEQRITGMPRFEALDRATRESGFTIVLLTRLSPLFPFNLLNYAFGLTSVSLRDYFFASWIGMLPGTVLYVYIGTLASDLTFIVAGDVEAGRAGTVLFAGGLVATLILTLFLTRRATHALRERLDDPAGGHRDG